MTVSSKAQLVVIFKRLTFPPQTGINFNGAPIFQECRPLSSSGPCENKPRIRGQLLEAFGYAPKLLIGVTM